MQIMHKKKYNAAQTINVLNVMYICALLKDEIASKCFTIDFYVF